MKAWTALKRFFGGKVRRGYFVLRRESWDEAQTGDWVDTVLESVRVERVEEAGDSVKIVCRHASFAKVWRDERPPQYLPKISFRRTPEGEEEREVTFRRFGG